MGFSGKNGFYSRFAFQFLFTVLSPFGKFHTPDFPSPPFFSYLLFPSDFIKSSAGILPRINLVGNTYDDLSFLFHPDGVC